MPSTPRNKRPQEISSNARSAAEPAADDDEGRTNPPNCNTSTFDLLHNSRVTFTAGVMTVKWCSGCRKCANPNTVVPEPMMMESFSPTRVTAARAIFFFSEAFISSFSLICLSMAYGLFNDPQIGRAHV